MSPLAAALIATSYMATVFLVFGGVGHKKSHVA
jgi:hypothetical protein